ncbi:hypothetical protein CVT25_006279 [Psilocybe cyanescens]|uniref:Proliferating cell nuclear antigen PCNA C-terminal domain-containing protein n=1 Tax=Psilocybe cyanescens TaxID=93625 RepID=A0A409XQE5_PSICY|nr:hypothetical protein CVT25_006279 [Psilocybe cyanescens]
MPASRSRPLSSRASCAIFEARRECAHRGVQGGCAARERRRGGEWKRAAPAERWGAYDDDDSVPAGVVVEINQYVSLTFSLKYLVNFSKSASLSGKVQLLMINDVPLLVAYDFTQGYIRYYLVHKISDD